MRELSFYLGCLLVILNSCTTSPNNALKESAEDNLFEEYQRKPMGDKRLKDSLIYGLGEDLDEELNDSLSFRREVKGGDSLKHNSKDWFASNDSLGTNQEMDTTYYSDGDRLVYRTFDSLAYHTPIEVSIADSSYKESFNYSLSNSVAGNASTSGSYSNSEGYKSSFNKYTHSAFDDKALERVNDLIDYTRIIINPNNDLAIREKARELLEKLLSEKVLIKIRGKAMSLENALRDSSTLVLIDQVVYSPPEHVQLLNKKLNRGVVKYNLNNGVSTYVAHIGYRMFSRKKSFGKKRKRVKEILIDSIIIDEVDQ